MQFMIWLSSSALPLYENTTKGRTCEIYFSVVLSDGYFLETINNMHTIFKKFWLGFNNSNVQVRKSNTAAKEYKIQTFTIKPFLIFLSAMSKMQNF